MPQFFKELNYREQMILLIGGICVLVYLLWMLLISPLHQATKNQARTNAALKESVVVVREMAAELKYHREQESVSSGSQRGSFTQLLDRSLRENGMTMGGIQPGQRGEVRLRLENVAFTSLLKWLHELEFQHGVSVNKLNLGAASEPGLVTADIHLTKAS